MINYTTLYHGSFGKTKPRIQKNIRLLKGIPNRYDGICATQDKTHAMCYGEYLHTYRIYKGELASNQDLLCDKAVQIVSQELRIDNDELAHRLTFNIATETNVKDVFAYLIPRFRDEDDDSCDDYLAEVWRLRGKIAYELGFKAVSYHDKDGWVGYLIVR